VKEAIQQHHVLVGMNRDMVIYAKGRAPKKDREKTATQITKSGSMANLPRRWISSVS